MDAILEAIIQLVLELLGEFLVEAAIEGALRGVLLLLFGRRGRWVLGLLAGLGVGCAWGNHLTGHPHYPRLLWVSLAFAVVAAAAATRSGSTTAAVEPGQVRPSGQSLRRLLTTWDRPRLIGLLCINVGLALGVVATFRTG